MGTTPNFALPFPAGADPPCDGATQIQALAEAYDDQVDLLDGDLAVLRAAPTARISYVGAPQLIPSGGVVAFNVVEFDSGGFTELGVFPTRLTFPRSGRYVVGVEGIAATETLSVYLGTTLTDLWEWTDTGFAALTEWHASYVSVLAGQSVECRVDTLTVTEPLVFEMAMWACWLGD